MLKNDAGKSMHGESALPKETKQKIDFGVRLSIIVWKLFKPFNRCHEDINRIIKNIYICDALKSRDSL